MPALWVICCLVMCQGPAVPVVRADEGPPLVGTEPASFLSQMDRDAAPSIRELLVPTPFDWYADLNILYLDRTLSQIQFGTNLGAVQTFGNSFSDLNPNDNRSFGTRDLDLKPQPGLRFLIGRTIWADPCDDRGCVAKPCEQTDFMRSLSIELGYMGLLQQQQATARTSANPSTPNGALISRFINTDGDLLTPVLWPFDFGNTASLSYRSRFDSAELNLRYSTQASNRLPIDVLAGVRYVKVQENLDYYSANPNPHIPSLLSASPYGAYSSRTDNDLIGLQVGGDLSYRLTSAWNLMGRGRGGLLVNSASQRSSLSGTLVSSSLPYNDSGAASGVGFAGLFEFGIHTNYQLSNNISLMVGYQGLFLSDLSTAQRQFMFNPEPGSRNALDRNGNLFYFGPAMGIEWKW